MALDPPVVQNAFEALAPPEGGEDLVFGNIDNMEYGGENAPTHQNG